MKWLNKLERKLGRLAIQNLMLYIVFGMAAVYLLNVAMGFNAYGLLSFNPALIMRGEIWRLFTFIFIPPQSSPIFIILALYFYYMIGNTLEYQWGSFKFNMYYLFGIVGTIIAGLIAGHTGNTYLNLSLFLAFAYLFPDVEVRLFFIIPIKVKWLAYLDWFLFIVTIITGTLPAKLAAIAALINFFIFFGEDLINYFKNKRRYGSVQRNFKREMRKAELEREKRIRENKERAKGEGKVIDFPDKD